MQQRTPSGHVPTLIASFLHFDVSFMLWVLLGALGIYIAESAGLSPAQKGLIVAIPTLSGSLMRIPVGVLSDRLGAKPVGVALLAFLFVPLAIGWQVGTNLPVLVAVGLMLGTAGASFAVALPLASRWYGPERQGLAMGVAAAGNSGTVIANLAAPQLANLFGWHSVLALAMIPLAVVLAAFTLLAKESPNRPPRQSAQAYVRALRVGDMWWFALLYSITFGGYVGLSSFLPLFFHDQYGASAVVAGVITSGGAFIGSSVRPIGGYIADKVGGVKLLSVLLLGICIAYGLSATSPSLALMVLVVLTLMACLGLGNGAVFQLVPQRFRDNIGMATGVVGAIGGLGGFLVPILLGSMNQATESFGPGFAVLAVAAFAGFCMLRLLAAVAHGWRLSWRLPTPADMWTPEAS
ncbi:MAG: NarK/NasA family nitrate transporter [Chloroflexi bacterium]|nr:NarK/NasA family nitrate transporter [Chloroflexota bacterium]